MMTSAEVRQSFLDFFRSKDHKIVPSAPVIPHGDPTLMFTNAGMNQFKDVFLGTGKRDYVRVADSQKCIRVSGKHNDLEEVGQDTYHHTFFEMLGNWSFGDYYKKEAIAWAWELLTEIWRLPKRNLWATVFREDDEAADLWPQVTDIDKSQVLRFDEKDNFWEMGETGPCGPCSEIHVDLGEEYCDSSDPEHVCAVNSGCARFIELWNLVFIQYNKDEGGVLTELPAKHVDTGAGLERIVAVLQNKRSNYDTDLFTPLTGSIAELTGKDYGSGGEVDVAFRVITDHIRALSFAIADGAMPSNEGRGYVLRRLLRRAARYGRVLDTHEPFIFRLVGPLVDVMGTAYRELKERHQHIARIVQAEEDSFSKTLDRGLALFEEMARDAMDRKARLFSGKDAFLLHDTYGFPLDLTQLMVREKGLDVDVVGFEAGMHEQRTRSRAAASSGDSKFIQLPADIGESSRFVGYDSDEVTSEVLYIDQGKLILRETPFYAEAGGQVGDTGWIAAGKSRFLVDETVRSGDHTVHVGRPEGTGQIQPGDKVVAHIDTDRRRATERNHTATHLLHKALRTVLGEHVHQAGSLVHPDHLRFDFTHFEKVRPEILEEIEVVVNAAIQANYPVRWETLPFEQARERGAIALFGEKYEDNVRMLEVDDYSRELCGGTHVRATGEIGYFYLLSESAIAAGVRRIEALTGEKAVDAGRRDRRILHETARLLACPPQDLEQRVESLLKEKKELLSAIKDKKGRENRRDVARLVESAAEVQGIKVVAARVDAGSIDELKSIGDSLRDALGSGVGVLFAGINGKGSFVCVVTGDLVKKRRVHAGNVVREVARLTGSEGGGSPRMAQAGAKDLNMVDQALAAVPDIVSQQLT